MSTSLAGRRVIVTGAGRNIGRVYALALAEQGARVVVADLDGEGAGVVAKEITAAGGEAIAVTVDIVSPESVDSMIEATTSAFGGLDSLVNNAAFFGAIQFAFFDQVDLAEWDKCMEVNVKGTYLCSRAAAAVMSSGSSIVNISSVAALQSPNMLPHYTASKAAVLSLSRAMARAYGPQGIRVNTLAPGIVFDQATLDMLPDPSMADMFLTTQIIPKKLMPEDLVGALLYLLSDDSRMVTGQTMIVDGGVYLP